MVVFMGVSYDPAAKFWINFSLFTFFAAVFDYTIEE